MTSAVGDADADVPVPRSGLRVTMIDEQTAILDRTLERFHVLNVASSIVWAQLDGHRTTRSIIDGIASESQMSAEDVRPVVEAALNGFLESDLIEFVNDSGDADAVPDGTPGAAQGSITGALPGAPDPAKVSRVARRRAWAPAISRVLDRLPGIESHGPWRFGDLIVTISTDQPAIGEYLDHLLEPMLVEVGAQIGPEPTRITVHIVGRRRGSEQGLTIYEDGRCTRRHIWGAHAVERVLQQLNLQATERTASSILLHAGAVEFDGRVVIVTGVSGRGKSTLTAALVAFGGAYVTDELVIIDPQTLLVRPYPKPLDIGRDSLEMLGLPTDDGMVVDKRHVPPSELGEISTGGRVAAMFLLEPADAVSEQLDVPTALAQLLPNVFDATHAMPDSLDALAHLCASVPVLRLPRTSPQDSVRRITDVLDMDR